VLADAIVQILGDAFPDKPDETERAAEKRQHAYQLFAYRVAELVNGVHAMIHAKK
jgi:hypothetical protein